jgi:hypothetical protein
MFHIETQKLRPSLKIQKPRSQMVSACSRKFVLTLFNLDGDPNYLLPNWDYSVDKFDDMGLKEEVLRGIYGYGFNKPSAIQMKGILPVIQGNDTIA